LEAYGASKIIAFQATETFIKEEKPQFDVITVGPGYIVGRDDTVTNASDITKGTNGHAFGQLLGHPMAQPLGSLMAHLDDVAKVHVELLKPSIKGNHFFLLSSEGPYGVTWDSALDIIKRRYPKEVEEGVFKVDAGTPTTRVGADSSYVEKTLGIKLNSYENAVIEMAEHYLELLGRK
jgi:nucleoside-diphosphate-sugar epimerase